MRDGTAGEILALLRERRMQARDLAAFLGIDTSAVRRHLDGLVAESLADAEHVIDGPGRPKKMYGLTAAGREQFPRDYALLLDLVLSKVSAETGREELERIVGLIAKDLGRQVEGRTTEDRLRAMLALYNKLGFEAELVRTKDSLTLMQHNCIFLKTARGDPPLFCRCLDEGIIRAALPGARADLEASLAVGDSHCRHKITLAKPRA
jgi:predicted ArsR family transcriptional regulator